MLGGWLKAARFELRYRLTSPRTATLLGEPLFRLLGRRRGAARGVLPLADMRRVLVIRTDEIGDMVLLSPFLRELRRNLPQARITLVVKGGVRNLVERCPYVDEVLTFDCSVWRDGPWRRHARAAWFACRHLFGRGFDLALVPRFGPDYYHSSFAAYFSGARCRASYSERVSPDRAAANPRWDLLFTHVLCDPVAQHEVQRGLNLLSFLGMPAERVGLEVWPAPEDDARAAQFLAAHGWTPGVPLVALMPAASLRRKTWPSERFAEVAHGLHTRYGARFLVVGGPGDEPLAAPLLTAVGAAAAVAAGRTSLRETAALLRRCCLYVGNDTGPMHLAAAAGVPVVEVSCHPRDGDPAQYGAPVQFAPWGVPQRVLRPRAPRPPCTTACTADQPHCILGVEVAEVLVAAADLLRQGGVPPARASKDDVV